MDQMTSRRWLEDAALAGAATAFAFAALALELGPSGSDPSVAAYVVAAVAGLALLGRRRNAVAILLLVAAARIGIAWDAGNPVALLPAVWLALYTVARSGERWKDLRIAGLVAVVTATTVAAIDVEPFLLEFLGEGAAMLLPIAIGDAVRSRADRVHDLIETEASSRVQAERLRIARDLHDVVAHGLSTIAIQSGVAAHLLEQDPNQARESLEIINTTGKNSLEELRAMVGVLRSTDDVPLLPTPADPDGLATVITAAANAGIPITTEVDGSFPQHATESCVIALHRIIQEALTNVARHAAQAPAHVKVQHASDHVDLWVTNEPRRSPALAIESSGVGIIGMVERAESLGGSLTAEATSDGGFQIAATLPYTHRRQGS